MQLPLYYGRICFMFSLSTDAKHVPKLESINLNHYIQEIRIFYDYNILIKSSKYNDEDGYRELWLSNDLIELMNKSVIIDCHGDGLDI